VELRKAGERIFTYWKMLGAEEGLTKEDYRCSRIWLLPRRTPEGEVVLRDYYGEVALSEEDLNRFLSDYYRERGWTRTRASPPRKSFGSLGWRERASDFQARSSGGLY